MTINRSKTLKLKMKVWRRKKERHRKYVSCLYLRVNHSTICAHTFESQENKKIRYIIIPRNVLRIWNCTQWYQMTTGLSIWTIYVQLSVECELCAVIVDLFVQQIIYCHLNWFHLPSTHWWSTYWNSFNLRSQFIKSKICSVVLYIPYNVDFNSKI